MFAWNVLNGGTLSLSVTFLNKRCFVLALFDFADNNIQRRFFLRLCWWWYIEAPIVSMLFWNTAFAWKACARSFSFWMHYWAGLCDVYLFRKRSVLGQKAQICTSFVRELLWWWWRWWWWWQFHSSSSSWLLSTKTCQMFALNSSSTNGKTNACSEF